MCTIYFTNADNGRFMWKRDFHYLCSEKLLSKANGFLAKALFVVGIEEGHTLLLLLLDNLFNTCNDLVCSLIIAMLGNVSVYCKPKTLKFSRDTYTNSFTYECLPLVGELGR